MHGAANVFRQPEVGSKFLMVENMGNPVNWSPLGRHVELPDLGESFPPITETEETSQNTLRYLIGGIHGPALVRPEFDQTDNDPIPGLYRVTYGAGIDLPQHPQDVLPFDPGAPLQNRPYDDPPENGGNAPNTLQPYVEWYKGLLRAPAISVATAQPARKMLEVARLLSLTPLSVLIYDPDEAEVKLLTSPDDQHLIQGLIITRVTGHICFLKASHLSSIVPISFPQAGRMTNGHCWDCRQ